jgi:peroxiredoxin-like protein
MEKHEYPVNLSWHSGRIGHMSSPGIEGQIPVATPPEFVGGVAGVWSPEHYFTAAVVGCYLTTFLAIAENSKLAFEKFDCESKGVLEKVDGRYLMTRIILMPHLVISSETDFEKAERILQKAEKACLISNSIKSEVEVQPQISVLQMA